jgi:tripartite ATP-independent transporter DctM subunit
MTPETMTVVMFFALLAGIAAGMSVAVVLGGLGLFFGVALWGTRSLHPIISTIFGLMTNDLLLALPLFVFMGAMMESSRVADRLFMNLRTLLGPVRGGLGIVALALAVLLAATTGIIGASIIIMASLALPSMLKTGYDKPMAAGIVCAGGSLGILIPPSNMLILYALSAGLSVITLFAAAVVPGLILAGLYMAYVAIRCFLNPKLGPALPPEERHQVSPLIFIRDTMTSLVPPLLLIACVLGSIFLGLAAPVEAAGVGALGALVLAAMGRRLSYQSLRQAALHTLEISSTVLWLVIGAAIFTSMFLTLGGGKVVQDVMMGLAGGSPGGVLFIMMVVLFVLGKLVCWSGILLICVPLFTPIAVSLGWDPVWFALVVCVNLQMSLLTPPFAYSIFYLKQAAPPEVSLGHIYRGVWPFIGLQAFGLMLIIIYPELVLWLPRVLLHR